MVARNVAWVASYVVVAAALAWDGATYSRTFVIIVTRRFAMGRRWHWNKCDSKLFRSYTPMPRSWNEPPMPVAESPLCWWSRSAILRDHHCFRCRCDPTRLVITDAIAAAESGPTHNRLNMSCPTAKMTGSSKAATKTTTTTTATATTTAT